jgi:hypothetical protein
LRKRITLNEIHIEFLKKKINNPRLSSITSFKYRRIVYRLQGENHHLKERIEKKIGLLIEIEDPIVIDLIS